MAIYRNKIRDVIRKQKGPVEQREPSKPTNFDLTKASEIAYLQVEETIQPIEEMYLPYLITALDLIHEKCEKLLSLYFFEGLSMPQIAAIEDVTRQAIKGRIETCNKKIREILKQLKREDE